MSGTATNESDQDYTDLKDDDQVEDTQPVEKEVNDNSELVEEPLISKSIKLHRRASQPHYEIKIKFSDINVTLNMKDTSRNFLMRALQGNNSNDDNNNHSDGNNTGSGNRFKSLFSSRLQEANLKKKKKKYQTDKQNLLTGINEEHEEVDLGIIGLGKTKEEGEGGGGENNNEYDPESATGHKKSMENKSSSSSSSSSSTNNQQRKILHQVSGELIYGELVGIVGASGGGKTTLVSILSGRLHSISGLSGDVQLSGHVTINDEIFDLSNPADLIRLSGHSAYVFQEDIHIPTMTAEEDVAFNAMLRLPETMTTEEKWKRVDEIMNELQLKKCANTRIGDESMRGLSGGEKKRVSIACELVTNPSFLILDEPTTGLDSTTSYKLMVLLKHMANQLGRLVLTTIHQPSSEIVDLFDKVFVMTKGQIIYFGNPREEMLSYLENQLHLAVPKHTNLLEFFLSQLHSYDSNLFIKTWKQYQENINKENGGAYGNVMLPSDMYKMSEKNASGEKKPSQPSKRIFVAPYSLQFRELLKRELRGFMRRKEEWYFRLVMVVFIALCQSVMFSNIENICENVQDRKGLDFLTIAFNCAMASVISMLTVPSMSNVIEKERKSNRMYSSILWVATRSLVVLPSTWVQLMIFVGIIKIFIPFNAGYGSILLVLGCATMAVDSIASIAGNATSSPKVAFQLSPLLIMPFLVFANYLITKTEIPAALRWLVNFSPWYWALNALATKDFSGINFECSQTVRGLTVTTHLRGNYILRDLFDIDPDGFGLAIGMLIVLFVLFRLVSFIPLVRRCGW